jgi:hypothetical protein
LNVKDVTLLDTVALCLKGFTRDQAVDVTVTVGAAKYRSRIMVMSAVVSRPPDTPPEVFLPENALFDTKSLTVPRRAGTEYYQSDAWTLLPASAVRDLLVSAGRMRIDASQANGLTSTVTQRVLPRTKEEGQEFLSRPAGQPQALAIYGFRPGLKIPVGLYEGKTCGEGTLTLKEQIGLVTMPPSGVVVYEIPPKITASYGGNDKYYVTAPVHKNVIACGF